MIKFGKDVRKQLMQLAEQKKLFLEGNIIKVVDSEDDSEFATYLQAASEKDKTSRKLRLDVTKQIQTQYRELQDKEQQNSQLMEELRETLANMEQSATQIESQNAELLQWKDENERMSSELKQALMEAEVAKQEALRAKDAAENDLDLIQKRTQTELIGTIVKVALWIVVGVGLVTTILYAVAIIWKMDTTLIGNAWSNMFGILLTNSFSIIGTIMGVKYATEKQNK
jgi:hypothetical protein